MMLKSFAIFSVLSEDRMLLRAAIRSSSFRYSLKFNSSRSSRQCGCCVDRFEMNNMRETGCLHALKEMLAVDKLVSSHNSIAIWFRPTCLILELQVRQIGDVKSFSIFPRWFLYASTRFWNNQLLVLILSFVMFISVASCLFQMC